MESADRLHLVQVQFPLSGLSPVRGDSCEPNLARDPVDTITQVLTLAIPEENDQVNVLLSRRFVLGTRCACPRAIFHSVARSARGLLSDYAGPVGFSPTSDRLEGGCLLSGDLTVRLRSTPGAPLIAISS